MRHNPTWCLFAVMDKGPLSLDGNEKGSGPRREEKMAGLVGFVRSDAANMSTEIGYVVTFPAFQRTYVTTNAVCLLLRFALEVPVRRPGALGLRRVEWRAFVENEGSVNTAMRVGFREEGTRRWFVTLPKGKKGSGEPREGDPMMERKGIDVRVLVMCCDDWENGGREKIEELISRV